MTSRRTWRDILFKCVISFSDKDVERDCQQIWISDLGDCEALNAWTSGEDRPPDSLCTLWPAIAKTLNNLEACVQSRLLRSAAKAKNYIWAMEEDGSIKLSVEEIAFVSPEQNRSGYPRRRGLRHGSDEKKLGHPTLVSGGMARIAGELQFDEDGTGRLYWLLNANSGRYCRQASPTKAQLDAVANIFRELEVRVKVDYL